ALLEELRAATPIGLFDLMRIPGLGTKRIRTLHTGLGVDSLDALEEAARAGRVAELPGFGEKTQQRILEGIAFARASRKRRRYPEALEAAARLLAGRRAAPGVAAAESVGWRRRRSWGRWGAGWRWWTGWTCSPPPTPRSGWRRRCSP